MSISFVGGVARGSVALRLAEVRAMTVVTIEEAKERIEELAGLAVGGEDVRITRGDLPAVELKAAEKAPTGKRVFGAWAGKIELKDDFFQPMPEDWLDLFYNGPVFPEDEEESLKGSDPR